MLRLTTHAPSGYSRGYIMQFNNAVLRVSACYNSQLTIQNRSYCNERFSYVSLLDQSQPKSGTQKQNTGITQVFYVLQNTYVILRYAYARALLWNVAFFASLRHTLIPALTGCLADRSHGLDRSCSLPAPDRLKLGAHYLHSCGREHGCLSFHTVCDHSPSSRAVLKESIARQKAFSTRSWIARFDRPWSREGV